MKRGEAYKAALHVAGDVFLIVIGSAFAALIMFAAMVIGGGL